MELIGSTAGYAPLCTQSLTHSTVWRTVYYLSVTPGIVSRKNRGM